MTTPTKRSEKARIMYEVRHRRGGTTILHTSSFPDDRPVFVLPAAPEDVERMREIMLAEYARQEKAEDEGWEPGRIDIVNGYLTALGLTSAKKTKAL